MRIKIQNNENIKMASILVRISISLFSCSWNFDVTHKSDKFWSCELIFFDGMCRNIIIIWEITINAMCLMGWSAHAD